MVERRRPDYRPTEKRLHANIRHSERPQRETGVRSERESWMGPGRCPFTIRWVVLRRKTGCEWRGVFESG